MDIKDAHKVIENLQTRPYICSENTIELDNGYVIAKKAYFKKCQEARKKQIPIEHHHTKTVSMRDGARWSVCPSCLGVICTGTNEYPKFCTWCGQAIDWSETV